MSRVAFLIFFSLLLTIPRVAHAASSYYVTFIPASPAVDEPITARVSSTFGPSCLPPPTSVILDGSTIQLQLDYSDSCASGSPIPSRDYAIGAYPAGRYHFDIRSCQNEPPPFGTTCTTAFHGWLVVGLDVLPIPTLSFWLLGLLSVGVVAIGVGEISRRAGTAT